VVVIVVAVVRAAKPLVTAPTLVDEGVVWGGTPAWCGAAAGDEHAATMATAPSTTRAA
jgi:hypothetical protein